MWSLYPKSFQPVGKQTSAWINTMQYEGLIITCHEEMEIQPRKELTLVGKSGKFHWALKKELFGEKGKLPFAGTQGPFWLWLQNHGWCLFAWWFVWNYDGWIGLAFWVMRDFARLLASLEKCSLPLLWIFVIYFLKEKYNKVVRYILLQLCNRFWKYSSLSIMPNREK